MKKSLSHLFFTLFCGLLLGSFWTLAWGFAPAAGAGAWYVDVGPLGNDGNNCLSALTPCQHIQAAVDKSVAGDTIILAAGDYTENLVITHTLTISGAGSDNSVIDGGSSGRVITTSADLLLAGLTIQNGLPAAGGGGGVYAAGNLVISDSVLSENQCLEAGCDGGGAYAVSSLVMTATWFTTNTAVDEGGGFFSDGPASLQDSYILTNTSSKGGGGGFINSSAVVSGTEFRSNACTAAFCFGGGLRVSTSTLNPVQLSITGSQVISNNAFLGAGAGLAVNGSAFISRTQFIANTSLDYGGALLVEADASIQGCVFTHNQCTAAGCHGAVFDILGGGGNNLVLNSLFLDNAAPSDGSLVTLYDTSFRSTPGTVNLANNTFASSAALDSTLLLIDDTGTVAITNSIFSSATLAIKVNAATVSQDYNLFYQTTPSSGPISSGSHSISGFNPLFATASSGDLRLLPGSPAIDAGSSAGLIPVVDIRGLSRPQLGAVDIGAYEARFQLSQAGGQNQHTEIGQAFPVNLGATLTSPDGDPVTGGQLGFFAPGSGASLTLAPAYTLTLPGAAFTLPVTANLVTGGPYLVQANTRGLPAGVDYPLTNTRSTPAVAFSAAVPEPSIYGQPFWITATVTAAVPITPGGVVTFTDPLASLELTGTLDTLGQARFSQPWLGAGLHTFGLAYRGDGSFSPGTPDTYPHQVNQADTQTIITPSLTHAVYGQPLVVSYTQLIVSPGAGIPTGTLQLFLDSQLVSPLPLGFNQVLTTSLPTLAPGSYQLWAAYSGDANFVASLTPSTTLAISQALVSLDLISDPNPSTFAQTVTFTAALQVLPPGAGIPTGVISITQEGQAVYTSTLDTSGIVSYTTAALPAAEYAFQAVYSGDVYFHSQASAVLTQTVQPADTTTTFDTSESIAVYGQPLTLTALVQPVAPGGGIPTGTLLISDSLGLSITGTLDAAGAFAYSPAWLEPGTYVFTATYLGTQDHNPSASAGLIQVINRSPVSLQIVASSPISWMVGALETITISVIPDPPGAGTPTGVITADLQLGPVSCSAVLTSGSGTCSLVPKFSSQQPLQLTYPGDAHFLSQQAQPPVLVNAHYYVDQHASGLATGLSWTDAFTSIQPALNTLDTYSAVGDQIWVAQGTYYPEPRVLAVALRLPPLDLRAATFQLAPQVALIGGFAGTETRLDQRNWTDHPTFLDGDLGLTGVISDNAYHVVTGGSGSIMDGFTIRGGNADVGSVCPGACGGGMLNLNSELTIRNLVIQSNQASLSGGGLYNYNSHLSGENIWVRGNQANANGGGLNNNLSQVDLTNLALSGNLAARGGGLFNERSFPRLMNATLSGNHATQSGSADYSALFSSPVYTNTILAGNTGPGEQVFHDGSGNPAAAYSLFESAALPTGYADRGGNLLGASPLLAVLPSTYPSSAADLRLLPGSLAIDAGTSTGAPQFDLRRLPRPLLSQVDMGAYETPGFTLSLVSGSNQAAGRGRPFKRPLVVQVSPVMPGEPVSGGAALFTAPTTGPSLSFAPHTSAVFQLSGQASLPITAGWTSGGPYRVTAAVQGPGLPVDFWLSNGPSLFLVHLVVSH